MNLLKPQTHFPILNLLWTPLMTVLVNAAFFGVDFFSQLLLFSGATALTFPTMFLHGQVQIKLSLYLRNRFPHFEQRKHRFAAWIFVSLPIPLLVIAFLWLTFSSLPFFAGAVLPESLPWAFLLGAVTHIIAVIVNEGQFTYYQWKRAVIDAERLQKITWESKYEGLKQQVNPHFLFNSINTLSSLIYEDRAGAGRYVKEMSLVYRYLLRSNDDELVPLQQELKFIQSYDHLLKTRFGSAIAITVDVPVACMSYLLPPLTLQMLVENAVKHNNVFKESPLMIQITCHQKGWLTVSNNLQPKLGRVDSTGIGLSNIREKYQLLGLPDVQLQSDQHNFRVLIPLVEPLGS